MHREMHTEVAEGMTTRSRRRNKESEVDAVMSGGTRNNTSSGMSASQTRKSRSKTEQVPKPNKIPVEAERDTTKYRSNTEKDHVFNEISVENKTDTELDAGQQKIQVEVIILLLINLQVQPTIPISVLPIVQLAKGRGIANDDNGKAVAQEDHN
jgi:hypothetical protein